MQVSIPKARTSTFMNFSASKSSLSHSMTGDRPWSAENVRGRCFPGAGFLGLPEQIVGHHIRIFDGDTRIGALKIGDQRPHRIKVGAVHD